MSERTSEEATNDEAMRQARGFLVTLASAALLVFDMAFDVTLNGDLSYRTYLTIWGVGVVVVLGTIVLPSGVRPVGKWDALLLLLPALFFPGSILQTKLDSSGLSLVEQLFALATVLAYGIAIPFTLYTLAKILNPDLIEFPTKRMRRSLVAITLLMGITAVTLARTHQEWLTWRQFEMDGAAVPADCTLVKK